VGKTCANLKAYGRTPAEKKKKEKKKKRERGQGSQGRRMGPESQGWFQRGGATLPAPSGTGRKTRLGELVR
jgi:hypothetical protein